MTPAKELILKDLSRNLRTKINRDIHDFLDLCEVAELDDRDMAAELMTIFIYLTASMVADHSKASAQDLASVMVEQFYKAKKLRGAAT